MASAALAIYAFADGTTARTIGAPPNGGATASPCRASQLSTTFSFQGTTQSFAGGPLLRNTSGSTCSLPTGRPVFSIVWRGKTLSIPVRPGPTIAPPGPQAHFLAAGQRAFIPMRWFRLPDIGGATPPPRLRRLCLRETGKNFRPQVDLRYRDGLNLAGRATGLSLPECGPLHSSWMAVSRPLLVRS